MTTKKAHITVWIIISLVAFFTVPSVLAQNVLVKIINNKITLKTERTPMGQVLEAIKNQSDIRIQCFLKADDLVTAELDEIPLKEGIELLLQRYNHAISYRSLPENVFVITDVFVHSRSIKTNDPLELRRSKVHQEKQAKSLAVQVLEGGGLPLYNSNPFDNDPLISMQGIDPLARFEHRPAGFESNGGEHSFLPSPGQLPVIQ